MNNFISKLEKVVKWWWDSFELGENLPKNGVFRWLVAIAIVLLLCASISIIFLSLIDLIIEMKMYIFIVAAFALGYFQTPKYKWSDIVEYSMSKLKGITER